MLKNKSRHLNLLIFIILGCGFFCTISSLGINEFWKSELALIPIQVMALVYTSYCNYDRG